MSYQIMTNRFGYEPSRTVPVIQEMQKGIRMFHGRLR